MEQSYGIGFQIIAELSVRNLITSLPHDETGIVPLFIYKIPIVIEVIFFLSHLKIAAASVI